MQIIANRQLRGNYGTVGRDERFECADDIAQQLLNAGLARLPAPPKILMETKVTGPSEVGPTIPFRDVPVPDKEPAPVAEAGDPVLSDAGLAAAGAPDPGRRGLLRGIGKGGGKRSAGGRGGKVRPDHK